MKRVMLMANSVLLVLLLASATAAVAQTPQVVTISPTENEIGAPISTNILVKFSTDMDSTTFTNANFVVNAMTTGLHQGSFDYDTLTREVTFDPTTNFAEGELVTVVLTNGIQSSSGSPLNSYVWSFTITVDNGSGVFDSYAIYPTGGDLAMTWAAITADFDNDGDIDIANSNTSIQSVSVLMNNGNGTFADYVSYAVDDTPWKIVAGDLDGDNDIDLVSINGSAYTYSVLLNNGNGTFASHNSYPIGINTTIIILADLNGDGSLDLVALSVNDDTFSVLLNNGDATFASSAAYSTGTDSDPYSVIAADFDGDNDLDLATANLASEDVSVFKNNGDGTFATHATYPISSMTAPYHINAADLDGDGDIDIMTANQGLSFSVSVLTNNGNGTFAAEVQYTVEGYPTCVSPADFDGDGDLDLAVSSWVLHEVAILLNNGNGTFADRIFYDVCDQSSDEMPQSVATADFNGDGAIDLVTANYVTNNVSVLLNGYSNAVDGDFLFNLPKTPSVEQNYPNPFNPVTVIKYSLPRSSEVRLEIINLLGQTVRGFNLGRQASGTHQITWDGRDNRGESLPSSVYFYRLKAGDYTQTKKMLLLK